MWPDGHIWVCVMVRWSDGHAPPSTHTAQGSEGNCRSDDDEDADDYGRYDTHWECVGGRHNWQMCLVGDGHMAIYGYNA